MGTAKVQYLIRLDGNKEGAFGKENPIETRIINKLMMVIMMIMTIVIKKVMLIGKICFSTDQSMIGRQLPLS